MRSYYKKLFEEDHVPFTRIQEGQVNRISFEYTATLEYMPYVEEIKDVVWAHDSSKAHVSCEAQ